MGFVRLFLGLSGRLSRAEFLIMGIVLGLLEELTSLLASNFVEARHPSPGGFTMLGPSDMVRAGIMLLFLWPTLCMTVKRFHDLEKSGWWSMVLAAPIVLGTIAVVTYMEDAKTTGIFLGALGVLAFVWPIIELGTFHGTPGDNLYGPRLGWKVLLPGLAKALARSDRELVARMAVDAIASAPARSAPITLRRPATPSPARKPAPPAGFGQRVRVAR